jgi:hypothetical protein
VIYFPNFLSFSGYNYTSPFSKKNYILKWKMNHIHKQEKHKRKENLKQKYEKIKEYLYGNMIDNWEREKRERAGRERLKEETGLLTS